VRSIGYKSPGPFIINAFDAKTGKKGGAQEWLCRGIARPEESETSIYRYITKLNES